MCGRLNASLDPSDLADEIGVSLGARTFPERYNVPPGDVVPIIVDRPNENGELLRRLEPARWGLVPAWAKDLRSGYRTFNARAETAATKPTFRAAFRSRRCALPVRGYYEWEAAESGKVPWLMESRDTDLLLMAGLYEFRKLSDQELSDSAEDPSAASGWLVSTTVLTTAAGGHLRDVHDRMPVMLTAAQMGQWIAPELSGADAGSLLGDCIEGFDPEVVTRRKVNPAVGNVRNEGEWLLSAPAG